jgi:hypothetical protein
VLSQKKTGRQGSFDNDGIFQTENLTRFIQKEKFVTFQKREEKDGAMISYLMSPVPKALLF